MEIILFIAEPQHQIELFFHPQSHFWIFTRLLHFYALFQVKLHIIHVFCPLFQLTLFVCYCVVASRQLDWVVCTSIRTKELRYTCSSAKVTGIQTSLRCFFHSWRMFIWWMCRNCLENLTSRLDCRDHLSNWFFISGRHESTLSFLQANRVIALQ